MSDRTLQNCPPPRGAPGSGAQATARIELQNLTKTFEGNPIPALTSLNAVIEPGRITGLVGPDGAGKTTLIRLLAGLLRCEPGCIRVCGFDAAYEPESIHNVIGYMPQRFGLYEDLTVLENLRLHADLQGVTRAEAGPVFARLLDFTDLERFQTRLAGKLSGGMKQKLGLACALLRKPRVLLLDEPSVGVDPLSRRELWRMVRELSDAHTCIVWSTSYLDEAERCDDVLLLNAGQLLFRGEPSNLTARVQGRTFLARSESGCRRAMQTAALKCPAVLDGVIQGESVRLVTAPGGATPLPSDFGADTLRPTTPRFEDAFVDVLGGQPRDLPALADFLPQTLAPLPGQTKAVVEAKGLTRRFGTFTAVDHISFAIHPGRIFGLLGPNGAGKSTTFKMLCGLLRPTEGRALVSGIDLAHSPSAARVKLGYMAQKFSLYGGLSVMQNLKFFSGVYGLRGTAQREAMEHMSSLFGLGPYLRLSAGELPLGFKQRLALACAVMHQPPVLFLDEPTSGVDPLTRREFWRHINSLVVKGVAVVVTTHFMEEAEYCDEIALVYRGRMIASGAPDDLKQRARSHESPDPTLEDAFIDLIRRDDAARAEKEAREGTCA